MKKGLAAGARREKLSFVQSVALDGSLVAGPVEGWEFVVVQQPVQPVAGKFRDNHGVHQRRDDSDECDVQAFVNHGCPSFRSLLPIPEANHDTAGELTLRSVGAVFKRQGTPSHSRGEMSHYVAGGRFLAG